MKMRILATASILALACVSTVTNAAQTYACPKKVKMITKYYSGTASCKAYYPNNGQIYPIIYEFKVVSKFIPETTNSKVKLSTTIRGKKATCTANVPFKRQETFEYCMYI